MQRGGEGGGEIGWIMKRGGGGDYTEGGVETREGGVETREGGGEEADGWVAVRNGKDPQRGW